jgi:chaperonin GroEL
LSSKQLSYSEEARLALKRGVDLLAKTVGVTLGPRGRHVVIDRPGFGTSPLITKDGVTVAKEIELEEPYENMGAQMLREVAEKTSDVVGDGTTTATVLAQSILAGGFRNVTAGANPMSIKRGIDRAASHVIEVIKKRAKSVKENAELRAVATVSANNDGEIGKLVADALDQVGREGVVTVEESKSTGTNLKFVEGMQFDRGYLSAYFATDRERMEAVLTDALVLLYEKKISSMAEFVPLLEKLAQVRKPLLIVSEDVEGEALAALVVNKLRGLLNVVAVKAPGFGDRRKQIMQDIAVVTGAHFFAEDLGTKLDSVALDQLGSVKRVVITKDDTTLVEGGGTKKAIGDRVKHIKQELERADSSYDKERLQERVAKLSGGVAVIEVGASTETEMREKKTRVENALNATRAASEAGVVSGGGVALLRAARALDTLKLEGDEQAGVKIVKDALAGPAMRIAENAGHDGGVVVSKILAEKGNVGFNAETGKFVDLLEANIVDPAKVTMTAVQNAASIAGMILTTEAAIVDKPAEKKDIKK